MTGSINEYHGFGSLRCLGVRVRSVVRDPHFHFAGESDPGKKGRYLWDNPKVSISALWTNNNNKESQNLTNDHFMIWIHHVLPSWYSYPSHLCHSVFLPRSSQRSRRKMSCKHNLQVAITTYDTWNGLRIGNIKLTSNTNKNSKVV